MLGRKNEGIPYFQEYEKLVLQYGKEYEIAPLYSLLGEKYLLLSMMDSAKFFLDKAEKIQLKNTLKEIGNTFKILSDWYFANGKIQDSRNYLLKYIHHSGSLKKEEEKIAAKVKDDILKMYELENSIFAKDTEIANRNLLLEKEKFQKYGFLGGLIIALLIAVIY